MDLLKMPLKDMTNACRVCHRDKAIVGPMRSIFADDRLPKIMYNVMHLEVKDVPGLPRFLCERCLDCLKKFSQFQVLFRRSEESYKLLIERRKTFEMDGLNQFARSIELERQKDIEGNNVMKKGKPQQKKNNKTKMKA